MRRQKYSDFFSLVLVATRKDEFSLIVSPDKVNRYRLDRIQLNVKIESQDVVFESKITCQVVDCVGLIDLIEYQFKSLVQQVDDMAGYGGGSGYTLL